MKILAPVPVEKVYPYGPNAGVYSYRHEWMEVEVVRIVRHPADKYRPRFFYQADVIMPACFEPTAGYDTGIPGTFRVNINRKRNPKWKPPIFNDGVHHLEIKDSK